MSFPIIDNLTRTTLMPAFLLDENASPVFAPIFKATFVIECPDSLEWAEEQMSVRMAGECWNDSDV